MLILDVTRNLERVEHVISDATTRSTFVQSCKQPLFPDNLQGPPHKWALTTQLYADEKTTLLSYSPDVHMLAGVTSAVV